MADVKEETEAEAAAVVVEVSAEKFLDHSTM